MALFVAYQSVDLTQLTAWYGESTIANDHHVRIANGLYAQNYYGTFLYYEGYLAGGTITNTDFFINGVRQFSVEGLRLPALTAEYYLDNEDAQGLLNQTFSGNDVFSGSPGNDTFRLNAGNDRYLGGAGLDRLVAPGTKSTYDIRPTAEGFELRNVYTGAMNSLNNVDRLSFSDGDVALDLDGDAGMAYRLYEAALDRKPDLVGLGYWIAQLDRGLAISEAANGFIASHEFTQRYGAAQDNEQFITLLYQNVLDRSPDTGGLQYWLDNIDQGKQRNEILLGFSESNENRIAVIGTIEEGIEYVSQWA